MLTAPMWVKYYFDVSIGVTVDTGNGKCIVEQVQERKTIDGTQFNSGDHAIAVRWFDRLSEDAQQRTFELGPNSEQFVVNSTELRWTNLR